MSGDPNLELEAILAEYYAQQETEQPAPQPPKAEAKARPEPTGEETTVFVSRTGEQDAVRQPEQSPSLRQKEREPRQKVPAPAQPATPEAAEKQERLARRRVKGRVRMGIALAVLTLLLAGLLWLVLREEAGSAGNTEPLQISLPQELEDYLDAASVRSHG